MTQKYVLITGASRGIGRACACCFASRGWNVIANCLERKELLETLKTELEEQYSVSCFTSLGDVGEESYVKALFQMIEEQGITLNALVNNAGIASYGLLQDVTAAEWNRVIQTNLTSVFLCSRQAVPHFLKNHQGAIVNVSSIWGNVGSACETIYSASKGGINGFTRSLAKELAPSHIRVNAVACGAVDTDMSRCLSQETLDLLKEEIPYGRLAKPEEIAALVYTLVAEQTYLTGQIVQIDGGWF